MLLSTLAAKPMAQGLHFQWQTYWKKYRKLSKFSYIIKSRLKVSSRLSLQVPWFQKHRHIQTGGQWAKCTLVALMDNLQYIMYDGFLQESTCICNERPKTYIIVVDVIHGLKSNSFVKIVPSDWFRICLILFAVSIILNNMIHGVS